MRKPRKDTGLWAYLDACGLLSNGMDEQIKAARRTYRKQYLRQYKKEQRVQKPEYLVQLSKENNEHGRIALAAKKHRMSVTAFLRLAALAYIERSFLVPDRALVAKLSALLAECLNDVRSLASQKGKHNVFALDEKYDAIERRIITLESQIQTLFCFPAMLEAALVDAVRNNPALKERLLTILSHARRED